MSIRRSGNASTKECKIPRTVSLLTAVRNFVHCHHLKRARVTCPQVLDHFIQENFVDITTDASGYYKSKAFHVAYQATCCWVKNFGRYKQGKRVSNLVPKKENLAKKHYYLWRLFKNCALPVEEKKREVYTYKSYIYESYNCNDNDSSDDTLQEADNDDNFSVNTSEAITVHLIGV